MPSNLLINLQPPHVEVDARSASVEVIINIQNLSNVVDQYHIEVSGLDSSWFTPPADISLFPEDKDQVKLSLHPTGSAARKGRYPFNVVVRSRGGAAQDSADGVLEIGGAARIRLDLVPPRQKGRGQGKFKVRLSNSGNADVQVSLQGRDAQDACDLRFPHDGNVLVPAGGSAEADLHIRAKKRPWVGPEQIYNFGVTATPLSSGTEPQTTPGQFTHRPWLPSWAPLKTAAIVVVGAAVLLVIYSILVSAGVIAQFPQRAQVALGVMRGTLCGVPALASICPTTALSADPKPDPNCSYSMPFKDYTDAETTLIGPCTSDVGYDGFGNSMQYSQNGVLFFLKASDTVYFFTDDSVYAYLQNGSQLLQHTVP